MLRIFVHVVMPPIVPKGQLAFSSGAADTGSLSDTKRMDTRFPRFPSKFFIVQAPPCEGAGMTSIFFEGICDYC